MNKKDKARLRAIVKRQIQKIKAKAFIAGVLFGLILGQFIDLIW